MGISRQITLATGNLLGRIMGASARGACLGCMIGAVEGLLIGPFGALLSIFRSGRIASDDVVAAIIIGAWWGAEVMAATGLVVGGLSLGIVQAIRFFSDRRRSSLHLGRIYAVAARCALLCALCGALSGSISPYSYALRSSGLIVEGAVVGWSMGFVGGAMWSRSALNRLKAVPFPFNGLVSWLWSKP